MNTIHYADESVTLHHGDCLDVLRELPDCSVDAVVTDPPYGLEFMGKAWDRFDEDSRARAGLTGTGYTDGAERLERPSFLGGLNPKCRTCGLWQRGGNPCRCQTPDFPNERRARSAAFGDWCLEWTAECLRVLKPGGHLLAFGGTRTWHRLACAVEDAGFEVRDSIAWLYGSGFPKSLDVSKAIERIETAVDPMVLLPDEARFCEWMRDHSGLSEQQARDLFTSARFLTGVVEVVNTATAQRPRLGRRSMVPTAAAWEAARPYMSTPPAWVEALVKNPPKVPMQTPSEWNAGKGQGTAGGTTDAARAWQGWGTALKPAFEPIVVGRKPLSGTVAANVLQYGTGALNVDGCRVEGEPWKAHRATGLGKVKFFTEGETPEIEKSPHAAGRWPANVVLDDSQADALDAAVPNASYNPAGRFGTQKVDSRAQGPTNIGPRGEGDGIFGYGDSGGPSRFFPTFRYEAKAPTAERPRAGKVAHPTVKPLDLMRWLVRLVTPPGGVVLEPFAGSGTTAEACVLEGFRCIAIEREADYLPLIVQRLSKPLQVGLGIDFGDGGAA